MDRQLKSHGRQSSKRQRFGFWNSAGEHVFRHHKERVHYVSRKVIAPDNRSSNKVLRGVSVFINHVSKRIQTATLKEAFEEYGKVLDVYIAYHNPRRAKMRSTFAFVRFSNVWEAMNAVEMANNRKMDGFTIKVFLDKNMHLEKKGPDVGSRRNMQQEPRKIHLAGCRDERSFKEALLSNLEPKLPSVVKEGQIVAMYDAEFIQQILRSEGFKVSVSCWYGFYVILRFEEIEQVEIFWDLKDSFLKTWFCDIDMIESFMKSKKLQVWVCIEGMPLEAWNDSNFVSIANLWGNVIRLDTDTIEKRRLDVARVLVGISCLSIIPPFISIELKGNIHYLRISTAEFGDERCWIDGANVNSLPEGALKSPYNSPRRACNESKDVDVPNVLENEEELLQAQDKCVFLGSDSEKAIRDVTSLNVVGPNLQEQIPLWPTEEIGLHDVPITEAIASNSSSGLSVSLEPVYDSVSGLFSFKPKYIKQGKTRGPFSFCSKLDKLQNWVSPDASKQKSSIRSQRKINLPDVKEGAMGSKDEEGDASSTQFYGGSGSMLRHSEEELLEAKNSLEVCKVLGMKFNADNEIIHPKSLSDHNPISLSLQEFSWGPRPFKWFEYLSDDKGYVELIKDECSKVRGVGIGSLLKVCKAASKEWVSSKVGSSGVLIQELEKTCFNLEQRLENGEENQRTRNELSTKRSLLWEVVRREEREWIQKSRLNWAVAGDRNTKFFHMVASSRMRANFLGSIKVGGQSFNNPIEIKEAIETHFKGIYNIKNTLPIKSLDCEFNQIGPEDAARIERPFSYEEIWAALSCCSSSKAPGPDGFNMGFLKNFWPMLKEDIFEFFNNFYNGDVQDDSYNHSFIVLIPKVHNPVSIMEYRPINLVGCVYKLLSKVLALRLGEVLRAIIGEHQFAFCVGKQILDCSLIANEVIDFMRKKGLEGVVFKVDFFKAYDTVDWGFFDFSNEEDGFWISMVSMDIHVCLDGCHFSLG
ncbi:hypothetical protein GQ457_09G024140 [Hibiscus cannabinus]